MTLHPPSVSIPAAFGALAVLGSDPWLANLGVSFGSSVGVNLAGEAFFFCGLGALYTAAVVGLLRLRGWARWLAIGLAATGLMYLIQPSLQPSPVAFMFGVLIIWYLLTDKAKQAFRAPLPEPTPKESIQADQADHP